MDIGGPVCVSLNLTKLGFIRRMISRIHSLTKTYVKVGCDLVTELLNGVIICGASPGLQTRNTSLPTDALTSHTKGVTPTLFLSHVIVSPVNRTIGVNHGRKIVEWSDRHCQIKRSRRTIVLRSIVIGHSTTL